MTFTETRFDLIQQTKDNLDRFDASHYYQKYGYVAPKYLRKYAFDKMIDLDIPESIADFDPRL
jgi:intergrase/recombinase